MENNDNSVGILRAAGKSSGLQSDSLVQIAAVINEVPAVCGEKLVVIRLKTVISEVFRHILPTLRERIRLNLFLARIMLKFEIKPR